MATSGLNYVSGFGALIVSGNVMDVYGRRLTLQPPEGARPGDDLLVDVPLTEETVFKLAFRVPPFAHGGDIIGITTPSGRAASTASRPSISRLRSRKLWLTR